jgi:hypothetical protein
MLRFLAVLISCLVVSGRTVAAEDTDPAKSPVLDVFPDGPGKGMNAVFRAKDFDATVDKNLFIRVQPKQDGKSIGPPVLLRFHARYSSDGRSFARDLVSLDRRPAPAMQPKKLEVAGFYEHKVRFSAGIQFSERGVTIEGDVKDPPVIKYRTVFAYWASFPASHQIERTTPLEEIKQLTEGHTVKFTDAKKKTETHQFWEVIKSRPNAIASAEVSGLWGSRRVIVEMPATQRTGRRVGNFGNYAVVPFYRGGWYFSRGESERVEGGPLTVRVE